MAGRSGFPSASAGSWHGPIPDVHTPTIGPSALASNASTIVVKSCHHTSSASCSKKPGRGLEVRCSSASEATISPFGRTRTPLELPVPKSTPISSPLSATFVPSQLGPAHPTMCGRTAILMPSPPATKSIASAALSRGNLCVTIRAASTRPEEISATARS